MNLYFSISSANSSKIGLFVSANKTHKKSCPFDSFKIVMFWSQPFYMRNKISLLWSSKRKTITIKHVPSSMPLSIILKKPNLYIPFQKVVVLLCLLFFKYKKVHIWTLLKIVSLI